MTNFTSKSRETPQAVPDGTKNDAGLENPSLFQGPLTTSTILQLQRRIGNAATLKLLAGTRAASSEPSHGSIGNPAIQRSSGSSNVAIHEHMPNPGSGSSIQTLRWVWRTDGRGGGVWKVIPGQLGRGHKAGTRPTIKGQNDGDVYDDKKNKLTLAKSDSEDSESSSEEEIIEEKKIIETPTKKRDLEKATKNDKAPEESTIKKERKKTTLGGDQNIRDIYIQCLAEFGITGSLAKMLAVDFDLNGEEITKQFVTQFLATSSAGKLSSCIDTSDSLLTLFGDAESKETEDFNGTMEKMIPFVCNDIQKRKGSRVIYQMQIDPPSHGFVIIIREGRAELLQSFANAEDLSQNIEKTNQVYSIEGILKALTGLITKGGDELLEIQNKLFDGSVDIDKVPRTDKKKLETYREQDTKYTEADPGDYEDDNYVWFYRTLAMDPFKCTRRPLKNNDALAQAIYNKIQAAALKLKELGLLKLEYA